MRKEWLGMLIGLGIAGAFSACESDETNDDTNTQSSTTRTVTSSSTGTPQGGNGGDGGSGASGGQGGSGGDSGGAAGAGGAGGCNSVPQPVGNIDQCGGTVATTSSGGTFCAMACDDQAANTYEVYCDFNNGTCECKYNNQIYCTCAGANGCSDHCCPPPWEGMGMGQGGGGQGGGNSSVVTATTSGQTSSVATTSGQTATSVTTTGTGP